MNTQNVIECLNPTKNQVLSNSKVNEIEFWITNNSNENCVITKANTSCGCTALKPGETILKPGDNKVTLTVNKIGQTGFTSVSMGLEISQYDKVVVSLSLTVSGELKSDA